MACVPEEDDVGSGGVGVWTEPGRKGLAVLETPFLDFEGAGGSGLGGIGFVIS